MAPPAGRRLHDRTGHGGAIAQLGERVVRNDEVGGSIPPGSTTLRPSGYAWRSHAKTEERSVPGGAQLGEDGRQPKILPIVVADEFARRYSAASDMIDAGMRLSQPSMKSFSQARSVTSCMARPSK